jgi:hypothetical protein
VLKTVLGWAARARPAASDDGTEARAATVATHEIARGRVMVTVHDHSFRALDGPVSCWTYVSDGLPLELVLSVQRTPDEAIGDYPRTALRLFEWLQHRTAEGGVSSVGTIMELPPEATGWLRDPALRGIAYTPSENHPRFGLPAASATALLLTRNELDAARQFGLVRLMGQLALRYRYFPTAAWCVRGRPDVTSPAEMSSSKLRNAPVARMLVTCAYLRAIETDRKPLPPTGSLDNDRVRFARQEVVLEISARPAAEFADFLAGFPDDSALTLLMSPDPAADALLVWTPGQTGMMVLNLGGAALRMAGNHVVFVPAQQEDEVAVLEDGFAVLMRDQTWREIRQLFSNAPQNWGMPVTGDIGFRIKISAE